MIPGMMNPAVVILGMNTLALGVIIGPGMVLKTLEATQC